MELNKEKIKRQIVDFAVNGVETFLQEHPDLEFYAFAFDCNAEFVAEVNLSFNTENDFKNTLKHYQAGKFSKNYQTEEEIKDLKFNTGDWEYQCFDTLYALTNAEINLFAEDLVQEDGDYDDWEKFVDDLLETFTESLVEFSKTETFKKIPKTQDFIFFCIDHDEDFDEAMERLKHLSGNQK